jgi:O-antigen/teichoic acid export membrane protein
VNQTGSDAGTRGPTSSSDKSFRDVSVRGGVVLSSREALGMVIRLAGVVGLTRIIGPADYGIYAGSVAIVFLVTVLAQMSTELFLVRQVDELEHERCDEVFTFLVVAALVTTVVALSATELVGRVTGLPVLTLQVLLLSVAPSALWAPAQATLERSFRFGRIGALELGGDVVLYAVALPLAAAGLGAVGAAIGFVAWQVYLLIGSCLLARYRPHWRWSTSVNRSILRFGAGITLAEGLRRSRELVNPVVVGALGGAAVVGIVALAVRLVETALAVLRAGTRVVFAGLARVQGNQKRFGTMLSEAMGLQTLVLGLLLGALSLAAPTIVPRLFGEEWIEMLDVLPWLSLAALAMGMSATLAHGLTVLGRTGVVGSVEFLRVLVLLAAAVPLVAALGAVGFGVANVVAVAPALLLVWAVRRDISLSWAASIVWLVGFGPVLFSPLVSSPWRFLLVLPACAAALSGPGRAQITALVITARGLARPHPTAADPARSPNARK